MAGDEERLGIRPQPHTWPPADLRLHTLPLASTNTHTHAGWVRVRTCCASNNGKCSPWPEDNREGRGREGRRKGERGTQKGEWNCVHFPTKILINITKREILVGRGAEKHVEERQSIARLHRLYLNWNQHGEIMREMAPLLSLDYSIFIQSWKIHILATSYQGTKTWHTDR